MSDAIQIAIFSQKTLPAAWTLTSGCSTQRYSSYEKFQSASISPAAFYIESEDDDYVALLLRQIRRDPSHFVAPIFVHGVEYSRHPLSDGGLPERPAQLLERITDFQDRSRAILIQNIDDPESLLLQFMWLRPGYVLEPQPDWQHPRRYRYPILEALDATGSDPEVWLKRMEGKGFIERVELKDRLRECDFCASAHLNFVDVCPNCRSIDIDQHSALHCFTCGYVAPESNFVCGDQRGCPKCGAQLRHIGSDYDRPMETNACGQCSHIFMEGDVIARCAICQRSMATTDLHLRKLYSWQLTSLGRLAAQGRHNITAPPMVDALNYATRGHFLSKLDWLFKIAADDASTCFSLACLRLQNRIELVEALGIQRTTQLLDEFAERLKVSFAASDLGTRHDEETIYILLPTGDRKRLKQLAAKVDELSGHARKEGDEGYGPIWKLGLRLISSKEARSEDLGALLTHLRGEVPDSQRAKQVA